MKARIVERLRHSTHFVEPSVEYWVETRFLFVWSPDSVHSKLERARERVKRIFAGEVGEVTKVLETYDSSQ